MRPHPRCRRLTLRPGSQTQNRCHVHVLVEMRPWGSWAAYRSVPTPLPDIFNKEPELEGGEWASPQAQQRQCVPNGGCTARAVEASDGSTASGQDPGAAAAAVPAPCLWPQGLRSIVTPASLPRRQHSRSGLCRQAPGLRLLMGSTSRICSRLTSHFTDGETETLRSDCSCRGDPFTEAGARAGSAVPTVGTAESPQPLPACRPLLDVPKLPVEVASPGPHPCQGLSPTQGWLPLWHRGGDQLALQDAGTTWKCPHCWPPPRKTPRSGNTGSHVPRDPRAHRGDHEARPWLQEPLAVGSPVLHEKQKMCWTDRRVQLHAHQGLF